MDKLKPLFTKAPYTGWFVVGGAVLILAVWLYRKQSSANAQQQGQQNQQGQLPIAFLPYQGTEQTTGVTSQSSTGQVVSMCSGNSQNQGQNSGWGRRGRGSQGQSGSQQTGCTVLYTPSAVGVAPTQVSTLPAGTPLTVVGAPVTRPCAGATTTGNTGRGRRGGWGD